MADGPVQGKTILVHGGAGAVGFYAVQVARMAGAARVIATVSRDAQARQALAAGAHDVINYRQEDVGARMREITGEAQCVDRVIEVAFGQNLPVNLPLMRPGGVIATYASDAVPEPAIPFWPMLAKDLTVRFVLVYAMSQAAHDDAAAFITSALSGGELKHQYHERFAMQDCARAHEATESMSVVGKVLVKID